MQPSKSCQKPARRAFQDGGAVGTIDPATNQPILKSGATYDPFSYSAENMAYRNASTSASSIVNDASQQAGSKLMTGMLTPDKSAGVQPVSQQIPASGAGSAFYSPFPQRQNSARPRLGYASGGMLGSLMRLTGLAEDTPERKAYKAAREAEKVKTAPPATKETPAPMGSQSVIDRRMQAAGLKNGGKIKGPGTPTSDSIPATVRETGEPIQVSTGERIVSAAQDALLQKIAKARGYESVDQMFEAETGKPVGPTIKGGKRAAVNGASQEDMDGYLPGEGVLGRAGRRLKSAVPAVAGIVQKIAHPESSWTTPDPVANPAVAQAYADPSRKLDVSPIASGVANVGMPSANARAQRVGDPSSPDLNDEFSNAMIENRNPGGMIKKVVGADGRTTYSGSNVTGDVSFQGADGNALPGRPGGGSMLYSGMSQDVINKTLTNPDGSQWSAGDNAIMAANIRDGVDKYRGTSRDPRNDPMNQPMTNDQRAARVKMAEIAAGDKRAAQTNSIAQGELDLNKEEHAFKQDAARRAQKAQDIYADPKATPEQKEAAKRTLIALGLLKTSAPTYHPGSRIKDAMGVEIVTEGSVFNPDTQEVRFVGGPGAQGQQATPRAEYDKLPKGSTYTGTDGKQYTKG